MGFGSFAWLRPYVGWIDRNALVCQGGMLVLGAVLGGLAMVRGSRWVVAATTAVVGAAMVVLAIENAWALVGFVPLALASFFLQIGLLGGLMRVGHRRRSKNG